MDQSKFKVFISIEDDGYEEIPGYGKQYKEDGGNLNVLNPGSLATNMKVNISDYSRYIHHNPEDIPVFSIYNRLIPC